MKQNGPEDFVFDQNTTEGPLRAGYTVARIKSFTPVEPVPIRKLAQHYDQLAIPNTELREVRPIIEEDLRIKMERMALTSIFIPQVWQKISQWFSEHPLKLAESSKSMYGLIPISMEKVKDEMQNCTPQQAIKILDEHILNIFIKLTIKWQDEQNIKLLQPEPTDGEERKMWKAYKRYGEILALGESGVSRLGHHSVKLVYLQILGGFNTARHVVWQSLGVLPEVYKLENNGQNPTKVELANFIEGVKPFILTTAHSDVQTLNVIEMQLGKSISVDFNDLLTQEFDPKKFWISKQRNNLYLEIKPEVLDEVQNILSYVGNDAFRTGCPALVADGVDGKNVVVEMYDLFARLYKELYINNQSQFK